MSWRLPSKAGTGRPTQQELFDSIRAPPPHTHPHTPSFALPRLNVPPHTKTYLKVNVPQASSMQLQKAQPTMRSDRRRAALGPETAEVLWNRLAVMDWPTCRKDQAKDICSCCCCWTTCRVE